MGPLLAPKVEGAIEIGDYTFEEMSGFYIIWNVTSAYNFKVNTYINNWGRDRNVSVGDLFKFTLTGEATFSNYDPWSGSGDPSTHPCICATISYYNSTDESWHYILGNQYVYLGGSSYAFLMYNASREFKYFGSLKFYQKFLLFMLPTNINLTNLGNGVLFQGQNDPYEFPWTGYSTTSDTLNFTYNEYYNYLKLNSKGIVETWEYSYYDNWGWPNYDAQITCEYLSSGYESPPRSNPNFIGYIIIIGICTVVGTYFIRKKILLRKKIKHLLSLD